MALSSNEDNASVATTGYEQSVKNFSMVSLMSDMVFSDGTTTQIPT